ncbi:MAG: hypothetical protein ABIK20_03195, partial [Candidatus Omnitrophota bacterium]
VSISMAKPSFRFGKYITSPTGWVSRGTCLGRDFHPPLCRFTGMKVSLFEKQVYHFWGVWSI